MTSEPCHGETTGKNGILSFVASSALPGAVFDKQGRTLLINRSMQDILGYSESDLKTLADFADRLPTDRNDQPLLAKLAAETASGKGSEHRDRCIIADKNGTRHMLDLAFTTVSDTSDDTTIHVLQGTDITAYLEDHDHLSDELSVEETLSKISTLLLAGAPETGNELDMALSLLLEVSGVSRVYIFENFEDPDDGLCIRQTHEQTAHGVTSQIDNETLQHLPYAEGFQRWREELSRGREIMGSVASLPDSERAILEPQDIRNLLVLPIFSYGQWYGFIGFDETRHEHEWDERTIHLIRTAAEIVGAYLERENALRRTEFERKQLLSIFDGIDEIIYVSDIATHEILYINNATRKAFGDVEGEKCHVAFQGRQEPCPYCTNRQIVDKGSSEPHVWEFYNESLNKWFRCIDKIIYWPDGREVRYEMAVDITDRKEFEKEIEQSREKYRFLFDHVTDAVVLIDAETGIIVEANQKAEELTGYPHDELVGEDQLSLHPPDKRNEYSRKYGPGQRAGTVSDTEVDIVRKDGTVIPVSISPNILYIDGRRYLLSMLRDEREKKRIERERSLTRRGLKLRNAISNAFLTTPDEEIYDKVLKIIMSNTGSEYGIFGYVDSDGNFLCPSLSREIWDKCRMPDKCIIFTPEKWGGIWGDSMSNKKTYLRNHELPVPEGHIPITRALSTPIIYRDTVIGGFTLANKKTAYTEEDVTLVESLAAYISPILRARIDRDLEETERRNAEEMLAKFKLGIELSGDMTFITNPDGYIIYTNPAFHKVYGFSREEVNGKTPRILKSGKHPVSLYKQLWRTLLDKKVFKGEIINQTRDGRLIHIEASANPILNNRGNLIGFLAIQRDITERKKAEKELERAKIEAETANKAKSNFLANMSHELRTPLNGVLGMAQLLEDSYHGELNERQLQFVDNIISSGTHLLTLINDILDMSKIEAGKFDLEVSTFSPAESIQSVLNLLTASITNKKLTVEVDLDESIECKSDEKLCKQILLNLLGNAVKFTGNGGTITVTLARDDGEAQFSIADTGIGIRKRDFDSLFLPFSQIDSSYAKKEPGTGLGLAISKQYVEALNGRIWFTSEYGKGSTFCFTLPIATVQPSPPEQAGPGDSEMRSAGQEQQGGVNKHVVLIEDNQLNAEVIYHLLTTHDYTVTHFESADKGMEYVQAHLPDLVIMDIQLPGTDGLTATRMLKEDPRTADIPIFALTAYAMKGDKETVLEAGCEKYITKPIDMKSFLNTVDTFFATER